MDFWPRVKNELEYLEEEVGRFEQENLKLKLQKFDKDQIIYELNKGLSELKDVVDKIQETCLYDELKCLRGKVWVLELEVQDLKGNNLIATQTIGEMKSEQSKIDDQKNNIIDELNEKIRKMENQLLEKADEVKGMSEVVTMYEEELKSFLVRKVEQSEHENGDCKGQRFEEGEIISGFGESQSKIEDGIVKKGWIVENKEGDEKFEKNQPISKLNKKVSKLQNEILDNDLILVSYEENVKSLNVEVGHLEQQMQLLKCQNFVKDLIISDLDKLITNIKGEMREKLRILGKYEENEKFFSRKVETIEKENQDLKDQKFESEKIISELNQKLSEMENVILNKDQILGTYVNVQSFLGNSGVLEQEIQVLKDQKHEQELIILELNKKLSGLENVIMQKDHILGIHEKLQGNLGELEQEILILKDQKLTADRMIDDMISELSLANIEQNKIVSESNGKMDKLKDQILVKDQVIESHEKKLKCFDEKWEPVQREIKILKGQILRDDQMMDEMKSEQSKAIDEKNKLISKLNKMLEEQAEGQIKRKLIATGKMVEKMRRGQLVAAQTIAKMKCQESEAISAMQELRCQNLEAFKIVEVLRKRVFDVPATKHADSVSDSKDTVEDVKKLDEQKISENVVLSFNQKVSPNSSGQKRKLDLTTDSEDESTINGLLTNLPSQKFK